MSTCIPTLYVEEKKEEKEKENVFSSVEHKSGGQESKPILMTGTRQVGVYCLRTTKKMTTWSLKGYNYQDCLSTHNRKMTLHKFSEVQITEACRMTGADQEYMLSQMIEGRRSASITGGMLSVLYQQMYAYNGVNPIEYKHAEQYWTSLGRDVTMLAGTLQLCDMLHPLMDRPYIKRDGYLHLNPTLYLAHFLSQDDRWWTEEEMKSPVLARGTIFN